MLLVGVAVIVGVSGAGINRGLVVEHVAQRVVLGVGHVLGAGIGGVVYVQRIKPAVGVVGVDAPLINYAGAGEADLLQHAPRQIISTRAGDAAILVGGECSKAGATTACQPRSAGRIGGIVLYQLDGIGIVDARLFKA